MPKSRVILVFGALIALLPLLGFPRAWESFFQVGAGLGIVILSVWATIDKKLALKHKAHTRRQNPAPVTPGVVPAVTSEHGKRVTDFYPRTAPPGRRLSDINPTKLSEDKTEF